MPGATATSDGAVAGAMGEAGAPLMAGVPLGGGTVAGVPVGALAAVGWLPAGIVPGGGVLDLRQAVVSRATDKAAAARVDVRTRIAFPLVCA